MIIVGINIADHRGLRMYLRHAWYFVMEYEVLCASGFVNIRTNIQSVSKSMKSGLAELREQKLRQEWPLCSSITEKLHELLQIRSEFLFVVRLVVKAARGSALI
ncbi:hypothetical protein TcasGA2_TC002302 [Tribolium castaneum]|uniref:Uncharacterized protein n=1 Tax=Tribolium castaneum TaxID=7070 RepID=D7EHS5_TRICA|nr:hypothetical protein TcasGA2_TC002302 [Tribolium castaneum]